MAAIPSAGVPTRSSVSTMSRMSIAHKKNGERQFNANETHINQRWNVPFVTTSRARPSSKHFTMGFMKFANDASMCCEPIAQQRAPTAEHPSTATCRGDNLQPAAAPGNTNTAGRRQRRQSASLTPRTVPPGSSPRVLDTRCRRTRTRFGPSFRPRRE